MSGAPSEVPVRRPLPLRRWRPTLRAAAAGRGVNGASWPWNARPQRRPSPPWRFTLPPSPAQPAQFATERCPRVIRQTGSAEW